MNGQTSAGFIVIEKEKYKGNQVDTIKVIEPENKDYITSIYRCTGEGNIELLKENFESTSFACKNSDKVQIIAFGGNDCTQVDKVKNLSGIVEEIFNQTTDKKKKRKGKDINVTAIGYLINPLLNDGADIEQSYEYPLWMLAKRIFNTDGTIEDIKNRASNTIIFSHCVGGVCVDRVIDALELELRKKNATDSEISEIMNSMLAINYAKYVSQYGSCNSKIPTVNLFQVYDSQNDGSWFMRDDISAQDVKKIKKVLARSKKDMSLIKEVKNWNGAILWNNKSGNTLNISLDRLKSSGGKIHNPSELIIHCDNSVSSSLLKDFMEAFNEWRDEVIDGKHSSNIKVPILRQKLQQNSLGKQM